MSEETNETSQRVSKKRRIVSGANAVVVVAVAIAIAVVVNAIASQVFVRLDLTENQIYTLSEASEQAAAGLEEPVQVKAFISPDLPPPLHNLSQSVADTLDEYAAASGGKLSYEIVQPGDDEAVEETARGYGCEKVAIGQQSEDEVSLRAVFKCVAFVQGEDTEVIGDLRVGGPAGLANFEYEFTKALLNLQETEPRKIAFVAGFGGPAADPRFVGQIQPVFEQLYGDLIEVTTVDLSAADATVPDDVEALVILNADQPFSARAKFALDRFVQRGGGVGWYQSAAGVDRELQQRLMQQMGGRGRIPELRRPLDHGLQELFASWGLELNADTILDRDKAVSGLAVTQRGLARLKQPATFPMTDIDQSLPFTREFTTLALPAPASIDIQPIVKEREGLEAYTVVQTDATAVRLPEPPRDFHYETLAEPVPGEEPGPFVVAAALQGDVPSFYTDHPLPEGVEASEAPGDLDASSRVLVVGSGEFFQPNPQIGFSEQFASLGGQFLISSLEWLVQDTALTQIRSKKMPRFIGEVPHETRRAVQFINIAAVPALFGVIGVAMMFRRRKRREKLARTSPRD